MNLEGTVTLVNEFLLSFTLDNKINVQMGVLIALKPKIKLPKQWAHVNMRNCHYFPTKANPKEVMLCPCAELEGVFDVPYNKDSKLRKLINTYNLGVTDLLEVSHNMTVMKENYTNLIGKFQCDVLLDILELIIKNSNTKVVLPDKPCMNKIVPQFNLVSVNNCRYIDLKSDKYDFSNWIHGVHRKCRKSEFLLGFVTVSNKYGLFQIQDSHYKLFLILINKDKEKLETVINSFVLIKEFKVITECYPDSSVQNFDYLLVDFEDLFVINSNKNDKPVFCKDVPESGTFKCSLCFRIDSISMVQVGPNKNEAEFWMQVNCVSKNGEETAEKCFLCFPINFVRIVSLLRETDTFTIHFNQPLKPIKNVEYTRVNATLPQYEIVDKDTVFVRNNLVNEIETIEKCNLLDAKQCKEALKDSNTFISFQGIIRNKYFSNPLGSRTSKKSVAGFGTPGKQTQQLSFFVDGTDVDNKNFLKMYLNNWERLLTPLGLVPYMRVAVRNVLSQGKAYLKCTSLTKIEVLSFEPPVQYTTVNLHYDGEYLSWGEPFYLGLGRLIPNNVIVWGRVTNIHVNVVKITNTCCSCDYVTECTGPCDNCKGLERKFDIFISIFASDSEGQSKIISKSKEFLRILLDISRKQFEIWLKAFEEVGKFEYNRYGDNEYDDRKLERYLFKKSFKELLETITSFDLSCFGLKCLKMKNEDFTKVKIPRPVWFCLDIKCM